MNRVLRAYSFEDWRVEREPLPVPGPGELLCRLRLAGACSGEAMAWYVDRKAPVVLGHELVAEVVESGPGAGGFAPGERVFAHHHAACGECEACRRGLPSNCELFKRTGLRPGGYAEHFVIPEPAVRLDTLPIPAAISDERGIFVEPLACCVRAVNKIMPRSDDRVLVVGAGVMGLLNLMLCARRPHAALDVAELLPARREAALRCGAERVLDPATGPPDTKYDAIIVCPSSSRAIRMALGLTAPGARLVLFAPPAPDDTAETDWCSLYFREVVITSAYSCGPDDTREALEWLKPGGLEPESLITERVGFDRVGEVLHRIARQEPALLKVAVDPAL